jgi:hypothetical protein
MKRREFITLLGGAAAWPLAARAQQPPMPVIGWLSEATSESEANFLPSFREALRAEGFVEGRTLAIEFHWAEGQADRLPGMAADLARRPVSVIVVPGSVTGGTRSQGRDHDDSDRLSDRGRPGRVRARCQPQPAGRQPHGRNIVEHGDRPTLDHVSSSRTLAPISASHSTSICSPWASSAMQESRNVDRSGWLSSISSTSHGRPRTSTKLPRWIPIPRRCR